MKTDDINPKHTSQFLTGRRGYFKICACICDHIALYGESPAQDHSLGNFFICHLITSPYNRLSIWKPQTLECIEKQKRNQTSHWRVKQGVSLNYTSLNWPQAGEALTLSRIQMWWSRGWGPTARPDPQVESRQAGPAVSRCGGSVSVWPLWGLTPR